MLARGVVGPSGWTVLSTLHTNSTARTLSRLVNRCVPEYIVRDVLRWVLAQDLQGQDCGECGGGGCDVCGQAGVLGRRLVVDLVEY